MKNRKTFNVIVNILRSTLLIALLAAIFLQSWVSVLITVTTLFLSFLPAWFERKYKIELPLDFELAIIFFVYATLFLGEVRSFYDKFWWWDIALHTISAMAFGCIGFVVMYMLFKNNKLETRPFWLAIFTFSFAVSIGVIWEIFEFGMDQIFGMNMQKSGLIDTMWDLIVDSIGALFISLAGYAFMKGDQHSYFGRLMDVFFRNNPDLRV